MISENNTRVLITMPKETKERLEKLAKEDNRSVNNLILTIINKYINNQPWFSMYLFNVSLLTSPTLEQK